MYALLDEQSDACFVSETTLERLGVDGIDVHIELSTVLGRETIQSKRVNGLTVRGVKEGTRIQLPRTYTRHGVPAKRSMIPRPETALQWPHLRCVANNLMHYRDDIEVGLPIGLNCVNAIKPLEIISGVNDEPYAKRTALGWGIIGPVDVKVPNNSKGQIKLEDGQHPQRKPMCNLAYRTQTKEIYTTQQVSKIFERDFSERDTSERSLSVEDRRFLKIIGEGIHQLPDGHYEMPLPFRNDNIKFQNNIEMALRRLSSLKKRFQRDEKYKQDYVAFMQAVIDAGHAERVEENEPLANDGKVWYIPHHGVYHPKKPDKIRVVFDCSATCQGQSLNRQLLQGPDLANSLVGVLCRFRIDPIAFMCDIEKMFHQVKVREDCRNYLRFLWWESPDLKGEPKIFRMTVHLFGAVSSPGCANFTLKKAAENQMLQKELDKLSPVDVFWTDSMIVLGYLNNEARRFHTFVSNRVQQIRDYSSPDQWHYVDTKSNPADHASRGLTAKELIECNAWWNGPEFLWNTSATPKPQSVPDIPAEDPEVKKLSCFASKVEEHPSILERLEYFSSWYRAKRAIALCIRLQERFKCKDQSINEVQPMTRSKTRQQTEIACSEKPTPVDVSQLQRAEQIIIKDLQREHFREEIQVLKSMGIKGEATERSTFVQRRQALKRASALHRLDPFLD